MGTPSSPPLTSKRDPSKDNNRKLGLLSELELIRFYKLLLNLYENKFNCFIPKLRELLSKIFNRKVELNVVFLKHMYLDSDILTQAVALKLKLRKNRV